ncbi:hypothetical protein M9H77_08338 [Catharanthus roseus]|uniref:Uncharacterized protein n=1 Tax=Catharanthus roseus TaxID=4058 RepID=A0ACC0BXS3_CATRO|nr:hypothetical protein M9H77_08338 [Catharanthus roseus]
MFGLSFQVLIKGLMGTFSHLTIVQSYNESGSTSENHEGQRQGQGKEKFMESSMGEKSTKVDQLSQTQYVIDRKVIHHEKNTCVFNSISILGHLNYNLWYKIFEVIDSRLNIFKRGYDINMNRDDQEANELIHRSITRGRAMKIKAYDDSLAKGMVAFIKETMKNKLNKKNEGFEDKGKPSKLLIIYTISKEFIMSTEGHLPSPSHQQGTNDPRRRNLNETL